MKSDLALILKATTLLLLVVWVPLIFIGFDSHHDGLILTTVHMLKNAIQNGGEWPFNQYGPAWAFFFAIPALIVPNTYIFLMIRVVTVICYFLTAFITWKTAGLIRGRNFQILTVFLFMLSQPFLTDYGSDLVPWPSAITMPFTSLVVFILIREHKLNKLRAGRGKFVLLIAGLSISVVIFSRIQVGVLMLAATVVLLAFARYWLSLLMVFCGIIISASLFFFYLYSNGWLRQALHDEFIFGFTYLKGDTTGTYPTPIFTYIGILFFVFLLALIGQGNLTRLKLSRQKLILLGASIVTILIASVFLFLKSRDISYVAILVTVLRRFWISLALATLFFYLLKILLSAIKEKPKVQVFVQSNLEVLLLGSFAIAAQSQVYPLFDQMHFWWGFAPAVIIMALVLTSKLSALKTRWDIKTLHISYMIIVFTVLSLIPLASQLSKERNSLPKSTVRLTYVPEYQAKSNRDLQEFFKQNIPSGMKVLNLCDNSEVYFQENLAIPSSRIFVTWINSFQSDEFVSDWVSNPKDLILTCTMTQVPSLKKQAATYQSEVLALAAPDRIKVATFSKYPEKIWELWAIDSKN